MSTAEELLDVLHEEVIDAISRYEIGGQVAVDIALSIEAGLRRRIGGRRHYLESSSQCRRVDEIEKHLRAGIKPPVIARRLGVARQYVYKIRKRMIF